MEKERLINKRKKNKSRMGRWEKYWVNKKGMR